MKTLLFLIMCAISGVYLLARYFRKPSYEYRSVDAVVAAFNEGPCIRETLMSLVHNPYLNRVICVNDGSADRTADVVRSMMRYHPRLMLVNQANTGKGGALMHGLSYVTARQVFFTDADTFVPSKGHGLGFMLAEIERGADAVGGIPSSNLTGAGLLPHIRATVKLPMIMVKRTFQQILGGAPFIISGACGMFRVDALRETGLSDRTKVEDLDLTWTLIAKGYTVRQESRSIVYPQECNTVREEWLRWRRWIMGYAVCMRIHWRLIFSRFGVVSMLPMFLVVAMGVASYAVSFTRSYTGIGFHGIPMTLFPLAWVGAVLLIGTISAIHHRSYWLMLLSPLAVFYVLLAYAIWIIHGIKGLATGREPNRDKPTRYANVVA